MTRRFEFVGGNSAKFWEIDCQRADVTVRYGRLGTTGQTQTKTLASPDVAERHTQKLIQQKQAKGYVECAVV
jgi:predicted DNA-binding WGR domain protein